MWRTMGLAQLFKEPLSFVLMLKNKQKKNNPRHPGLNKVLKWNCN